MSNQVQIRRKQLAAIHAARRDLGLDEDGYRLMLRQVAGVDSAKDLDASGRRAVLDHLRRVGWSQRPRRRVAQHPGTPHNLDNKPMLQKIEALLAELKAPWSYADAIARRQYRIERCAWLKTVEQYTGVIAALDVELSKRRLLATLERCLERQSLTLDDVETQFPALPKNWRRNRAALWQVLEHYDHAEALLELEHARSNA